MLKLENKFDVLQYFIVFINVRITYYTFNWKSLFKPVQAPRLTKECAEIPATLSIF